MAPLLDQLAMTTPQPLSSWQCSEVNYVSLAKVHNNLHKFLRSWRTPSRTLRRKWLVRSLIWRMESELCFRP